jgi:hypothetical protein
MTGKPSYIPDEIWDAAKAVSCRFASDAEVLRLAKSLVRRQRGEQDPPDEDKIKYWPGLTARSVRVIRDALLEYDTAIELDAVELFRLRSLFGAEAAPRGRKVKEDLFK